MFLVFSRCSKPWSRGPLEFTATTPPARTVASRPGGWGLGVRGWQSWVPTRIAAAASAVACGLGGASPGSPAASPPQSHMVLITRGPAATGGAHMYTRARGGHAGAPATCLEPQDPPEFEFSVAGSKFPLTPQGDRHVPAAVYVAGCNCVYNSVRLEAAGVASGLPSIISHKEVPLSLYADLARVL